MSNKKINGIFLILSLCILFLLQSCDKPNKIKYVNADYYAVSRLDDGNFVCNEMITFYSKNDNDTILYGVFSNVDKKSFINGLYKKSRNNKVTRAYGIFSVKNNSEKTHLTSDKNEGSALDVSVNELYRYEGYWGEKVAIIDRKNETNYILTVKPQSGNVKQIDLMFKNGIFRHCDYYDIEKVFSLCTKDTRIVFKDGKIFRGSISCSNNNLDSIVLSNGVMSFSDGLVSNIKIEKIDDNCYMCDVDYFENGNSLYSRESFFIDGKTYNEHSWGEIDFYMPNVKSITFKNGNVFKGFVEYEVDGNSGKKKSMKLRNGRLTYKTGEVFVGDYGGDWNYGIPVSGKMKLSWKDGYYHVVEGDWLGKYNLDESNKRVITAIESPKEKYITAENLYYELVDYMGNTYGIDYEEVNKNRKKHIDYFDNQFLYYVYNTSHSDYTTTHSYNKRQIDFGLFGVFFTEHVVVDCVFDSYFSWWNIKTESANDLFKAANKIVKNGLIRTPKEMYSMATKSNNSDSYNPMGDYKWFLHECESFIRSSLNESNGDLEKSTVAKLWQQRLYTLISKENYDKNYRSEYSYDVFIQLVSVALVNDFLVGVSMERDRLGSTDYMYY